MAVIEVLLNDSFDQWRVKTNEISSNAGDLSILQTDQTGSLVEAINDTWQYIGVAGDLTDLDTVDKSTLVAAVNEVNGITLNNQTNITSLQALTSNHTTYINDLTADIGNLALLTTTDKDDLVQAINFTYNYAQGISAGSGFEEDLGDPSVDGYVLSSTTTGARSWVKRVTTTDLDDAIDARVPDKIDTLNNVGNAGLTPSFDCHLFDSHYFVCDQATTDPTLTNFNIGRTVTLIIVDGGSTVFTWPDFIHWPNEGAPPELSASGTDRVVLQKIDTEVIHASVAGQLFAMPA